MSTVEMAVLLLAGLGAGLINTVVGSGTLITFPTLLFFGYPAVVANLSNTIGLVAGGVSGSLGYRREVSRSARLLWRLLPVSIVGAAAGAVLLLVLPAAAFTAIVPVLIGLGLVLVVAGPSIQRRVVDRQEASGAPSRWRPAALVSGVGLAGVYGGYFGAAQGVILMGVLSALSSEPLQRLNGYKNVLATAANVVAAISFMVLAGDRIVWPAAAAIAAGSLAGGMLGARIGRWLPDRALRGVILVVGVVGIVRIV